ncbi:MAG TPA: BON domain-containing protein, partial [Leclercia adecarboxylata]|nr:BON domain-containing protein [Leclercia adecarboxylata]
MSNTTRTLIASALTLGLALSSSAAFAKDPAAKSPPATSAHPATHADRHDSNEPVTDSWITTKVKADLLTSSNVPGTEIKV